MLELALVPSAPPPTPAGAATATAETAVENITMDDGSTATAATTAATAAANSAESYEQEHVHSVYESIASHFSSTRYKPWPNVASFLTALSPGSVGLDVGCGNGKYLNVNPHVYLLGSDRSANLAQLARDLKVRNAGAGAGADVVGVADGLSLPFGAAHRRVDFAICIAVLHHLSTRERRVDGLRALLDCVHPRAGKVLVYVWALEQGSSRRGWDEGTADQDQLVPWVMKQQQQQQKSKKTSNKKAPKKKEKGEETGVQGGEEAEVAVVVDAEKEKEILEVQKGVSGGDTTYQRYYHLYRKGELEEDARTAGGEVLDSGYDRDNWWVIASPREEA